MGFVIRTLPVAPLWCDLGCQSQTVVVIKAAAKTGLYITKKIMLPSTSQTSTCGAYTMLGSHNES